MRIGGFVKSSLIDYPGKVAAVIFTQGCNFRCVYCYNPELVYPERFAGPIPIENIYEFLQKRRGLLDGVVLCGGEPTLQEDIVGVISEIRAMGYAVKLDTNGSNPDILPEILPLLDYIAMDVKAPFGSTYERICGTPVDIYDICRSVFLIQSSGIKYEFRTTLYPPFVSAEDSVKIRSILKCGSAYTVKNAVAPK